MDKKALISITSNAGVEGDEVIEVISPGKYIRFDDGFKAVYEETEISGMDGTTTTLTIKDREVVLEREGTTNTKMYFNEKEDTNIDKELKIDMDEDGGELVIGYSLAVAGQAPLDTKLSLKIKTQ